MKRFSKIEQQIRDLINELSQYKDLFSTKEEPATVAKGIAKSDDLMLQLTDLLAEVNHKRMMYFKMKKSSLFDYSDLPIDGYSEIERKFLKIKSEVNRVRKTV